MRDNLNDNEKGKNEKRGQQKGKKTVTTTVIMKKNS